MKSARGTGLYWDLDGAQAGRGRVQGRVQGLDVEYVGGEATGLDAGPGQLGCEDVQVTAATSDQGHGMASRAEAAGGSEPEAGTGSDEGVCRDSVAL